MRIYELTEGFQDWFGLNKPGTQQAMNTLSRTALARFTRDPRYQNLPLDQRIDVMAKDQAIAKIANEHSAEFAELYKNALYANQNRPLGPELFKNVMKNFLNTKIFNRNINKLAPEFQTKLDALITQAQRSRFDYRTGFGPEFDQAMKDIMALKLMAQYESTATTPAPAATAAPTTKITTPPSPGAPTPAEQARLQQMIQQKLGNNE